MSKLDLHVINNDTVVWKGLEYRKADWPIQEGDIVQAFEEDEYFTKEGFYKVESLDDHNGYFTFLDEDDDERERNVTDIEFVPFRKVTSANSPVQTIVIEHPVHLILKGAVTIEIQGGVTLGR